MDRRILFLALAAPLCAAPPTPRLLLTAGDFARIDALAKSQDWTASARNGIAQGSQSWPSAYTARYGLNTGFTCR